MFDMDLSRLGSNNWSEPGKLQENAATASQSVASFIHDIDQLTVATTMGDLLSASNSKRRIADNAARMKSSKNISLSATAPPALFPALKKSTTNFTSTDLQSPMIGNQGRTIQFGKTNVVRV